MLIEFSVTNFGAIHARQTLSMVASNYFKELEELNTFAAGADDADMRLLRSAVLYGPNASGKSTLIRALQFVATQVLTSQKESQSGDPIEVQPFKLSAQSRASDSAFEISFVEQGVRYEYGFCCNRERFTEEWLFAYPKGRAQKWFHRVFNRATDTDAYKFSRSFKSEEQHKIWAAQTRPNALFLSTAIQLNNAQLKPAFDWFKKRLQVIDSDGVVNARTIRQCRNEDYRKRVVELMNSADLRIADIQIQGEHFSADMLPKEMPTKLKEQILKDLGGKLVNEKPRFLHCDVDTQELIAFDEAEESQGTQALFAFAGFWLDVTDNEKVLVVDELDTSLHPLLVQHLVKLLHHRGNKAQLIFTTHDTSLLSQKLLRRDQVWFMEKDDRRATHLYPLSDFSPRDNAALEQSYLNGRFGGMPFLKDLDFHGV
jgi:AAA15 family ATPase/GTPase